MSCPALLSHARGGPLLDHATIARELLRLIRWQAIHISGWRRVREQVAVRRLGGGDPNRRYRRGGCGAGVVVHSKPKSLRVPDIDEFYRAVGRQRAAAFSVPQRSE